MPRRFSENKEKTIETGIAFCPETGERLDNVRYNTRDLIRKSQCKNTWAQGVVKALFENEPEYDNSLKHSAESVLSNLHNRATEFENSEVQQHFASNNFSQLEKRTKRIKVRKVKKNTEKNAFDPKLRSVIESIIDEKIAQV